MRYIERAAVPRATIWLIVANSVIFLLQQRLPASVDTLFGLSARGIENGWLWQFLTYQFLHGSLTHLLLNMLALWFAGRELERVIGTRAFLLLYVFSGVLGGATQILFSPESSVIGASGSVCGVLLAMTALFPDVPITALILFVLPLRMKARYFGIVLVVASVLLWLSGIMPNVGHLAHLGGFLGGFLFARGYLAWERKASASGRGVFGTPVFEVVGASESPATSVEEVLEKVLREGIGSLSRSEHALLEHARGQKIRRWQ